MPKPTKGPRLGGSSAHQKALLANLATALFEHGRIKTTEPKARALRPYAEKLITHAKKGTLHNRREVLKKIRDKDVVHALFAEIGPFFSDRNGGYTRIIKVENRKGDNAPMAVIELVQEKTVTSEADRARRAGARRPATSGTEAGPRSPELFSGSGNGLGSRPPHREGMPPMARLVGVDLPRDKRMEVALTYIFGVGRTRSNEILAATGIDKDLRTKDLTDDQVTQLRDYIEGNLKVEGDLRREVQADIRRKIEIGCYQGLRHRRGLPVRGQRTKTNARTRKGPKRTIAGKKKAR